MSNKSLKDILNMSNEEALEEGRTFVYVATKKGGCDIIRESLKCLNEKVYVGESGRVIVEVPEGCKKDYPVYVRYDKDSGMWKATTQKPNVPEDRFFNDTQLARGVLFAAGITDPLGMLFAILGC